MRFVGRVAIVTGGASGMGAATCRLFAAEGAKVAIADVQDGSALAAELGEAARYYRHDVTDPDAWTALVEQVEAELGPIDILVNNAGVLVLKTLVDTTPEEFRRVQSVNLEGPFLGMRAVIPGMVARGKGAIVNVSSMDGLRGANALGPYTASKWGLRGLTKVAALELAHKGIRVNSIHPGTINTPMGNPGLLAPEEINRYFVSYPAQRMGHPEEVARATLFLCSDDASYIMGAELAVDGGVTAGDYMPGLGGEPDALKPG